MSRPPRFEWLELALEQIPADHKVTRRLARALAAYVLEGDLIGRRVYLGNLAKVAESSTRSTQRAIDELELLELVRWRAGRGRGVLSSIEILIGKGDTGKGDTGSEKVTKGDTRSGKGVSLAPLPGVKRCQGGAHFTDTPCTPVREVQGEWICPLLENLDGILEDGRSLARFDEAVGRYDPPAPPIRAKRSESSEITIRAPKRSDPRGAASGAPRGLRGSEGLSGGSTGHPSSNLEDVTLTRAEKLEKVDELREILAGRRKPRPVEVPCWRCQRPTWNRSTECDDCSSSPSPTAYRRPT